MSAPPTILHLTWCCHVMAEQRRRRMMMQLISRKMKMPTRWAGNLLVARMCNMREDFPLNYVSLNCKSKKYRPPRWQWHRLQWHSIAPSGYNDTFLILELAFYSKKKVWIQWHSMAPSGYSDTFSPSQLCHCKRGGLYCNLKWLPNLGLTLAARNLSWDNIHACFPNLTELMHDSRKRGLFLRTALHFHKTSWYAGGASHKSWQSEREIFPSALSLSLSLSISLSVSAVPILCNTDQLIYKAHEIRADKIFAFSTRRHVLSKTCATHAPIDITGRCFSLECTIWREIRDMIHITRRRLKLFLSGISWKPEDHAGCKIACTLTRLLSVRAESEKFVGPPSRKFNLQFGVQFSCFKDVLPSVKLGGLWVIIYHLGSMAPLVISHTLLNGFLHSHKASVPMRPFDHVMSYLELPLWLRCWRDHLNRDWREESRMEINERNVLCGSLNDWVKRTEIRFSTLLNFNSNDHNLETLSWLAICRNKEIHGTSLCCRNTKNV